MRNTCICKSIVVNLQYQRASARYLRKEGRHKRLSFFLFDLEFPFQNYRSFQLKQFFFKNQPHQLDSSILLGRFKNSVSDAFGVCCLVNVQNQIFRFSIGVSKLPDNSIMDIPCLCNTLDFKKTLANFHICRRLDICFIQKQNAEPQIFQYQTNGQFLMQSHVNMFPVQHNKPLCLRIKAKRIREKFDASESDYLFLIFLEVFGL